MNNDKAVFFKRSVAAFVLALFLPQTTLPVLGHGHAQAAVVVGAHLKSDMAVLDVDQKKVSMQKPNILFLIEATEIMSFTTKGVQPQVWRDPLYDVHWEETADWKLTKERYGYTIYDINRIMKEATFGMGAMPPAWSGGNLYQGRNLYGRERSQANNFVRGKNLKEDMEMNKDRYYFPFADPEYSEKYLVGAYNMQHSPLEIGYENYPQVWPDKILPREYRYEARGRAGYDYMHANNHNHPNTNDAGNFDGDSVLAPYSYSGAVRNTQAYPYALVFKDPKHWANPPSSWKEEDLVPNDSRMYQTKLVLWNLLSDSGRFKDVRIGMATTFLSPANLERAARQRSQHHHEIAWDQNPDTNGVFKVFPFGANIRTKSYFLPENRGGDAYIKDLGPRNSTNWSEKNVYRRKEIPSGSGRMYSRVQYENGAMHGPATGEVEAFFHIHGQHYPLWHNASTHAQYMTPNDDGSEPDGWWSNGAVPKDSDNSTVTMADGWYEGTKTGSTHAADISKIHDNDFHDMSIYNEYHTRAMDPKWHSAGEAWDRPLYKILRRASLWLPILDSDYEWKRGWSAIGQIDKFRLWINGFADIRSDGDVVTDWNESSWAYHSKYVGGVARNAQWYVYKDPEIGVAGMFGLAQAIFPDPTPLDYTPGHTRQWNQADRYLDMGRNYYRKRGWVWYSKRDKNIDYTYDYRRASQEYDDTAVPRARFNYGSGEAAGSVLDFFSPKLDYSFTGSAAIRTDEDYAPVTQPQIADSGGGHRISVNTDLHRVSFPIRSSCEDNWLIVVASGAEPKITDRNAYSYNAWEAIKNLYDATDKKNKGLPMPAYDNKKPSRGVRKAPYERVTRIKPSVYKDPLIGTERGKGLNRRDLEEIDLDRPIRTLVIGMVASEHDPDVIKAGPKVVMEVLNMRLNLIKMANAGQAALSGKEIDNLTFSNMYSAPVQPYWADDVASLKIAFDAVLGAVQAAQAPKTAGGSKVEQRTDSSLEDSKLFSATYQVVYNNQWRGTLRRYLPVIKNGQIVSMDTAGSWELGDKLLKKRGSGNAPGNIRPSYWAPGPGGGSFKELRQQDASAMDIFGVGGKLITAVASGAPLDANEALYQWIAGYDYSYVQNRSYKRAHMLADFGQSGLAVVANPNKSLDALPGYSAWAKARPETNRPMLYGQTNDGLLYVVDPLDGNPEKIILPPPALLPMRLAALKTMPAQNGNRVWVDVATEDGVSGGKRSIPAFTLDGSLAARNFDFGDGSSHKWRQTLLGTLGRGGNGLYMLDVSDHANPKFSWYRERFGDMVVSMDRSTPFGRPAWIDSKALAGKDAAWLKLGYYGAKPALGVAMADGGPAARNFIVVPGGVQEKIDLADNGKEGAALLILDPKDGGIIRAFDSDFIAKNVDEKWRVGNAAFGYTPYMGMIVSEPTLMRSSNTALGYARFVSGAAYASDNRGNIFKVAMEKEGGESMIPSEWGIRTAATLQSRKSGNAGTKNSFAVPHGVALKKNGGSVWLVGGTANVDAKMDGGIVNGDASIGQMIFSIKTPLKASAQDRTVYRDDLARLDPDSNVPAPSGGSGWYIPLLTAARTKRNIMADEYVTARPAVLGDIMYVPTFTLSGIDLSGVDDICNSSKSGISGYSRIYALNYKDGRPSFKGTDGSKRSFIQVEGAKITGVTKLQNDNGATTLVLTYESFSKDPFENPEFKKLAAINGMSGISAGEIALHVDKKGERSGVGPDKTVILYWIQK
ncbi:MAG: hypothetical protein LBF92_10815 [Synergistaceae bacterium]|nr:hypothetical protein [Synergistaceae bacterium]